MGSGCVISISIVFLVMVPTFVGVGSSFCFDFFLDQVYLDVCFLGSASFRDF